MKKQLFAAGILAASLFALTAKKADPVLMTVAGKDVPVSEFEYLYHKNNSQQAEPQSIDSYLDMFINFKLKVADAEAAGLDTTASFRNEFYKFRNELAEPYLQDTTVMEALVEEAYRHKLEEIVVSHIMVRPGQEDLIDSIRTAIVNGETTFSDAARKYSVDAQTAARGGLLGKVIPVRLPWAFEKAAYDTPEGEISSVVNSGFGLHIIRVESRVPSRGDVSAKHILRTTRGVTPEDAALQKGIIDSLYNIVVADPSKFEELAMNYSDDPGSSRHGGDLGWFSSGMMVAEFDSAAFAIPVGTISKPFKTAFGWHIIKKEDQRPTESFEECREDLLNMIKFGDGGSEPTRAFLRQAAKKYKAHLDNDNISKIASLADAIGTELDSAMVAGLSQYDFPVYSIGKKSTSLADVMGSIKPSYVQGGRNIQAYIAEKSQDMMNQSLIEMAREDLAKEDSDYRNLVNEYRDGILLFEISNRTVWDKAAKDREGLEAYFLANKSKYKWNQPKFKSFILFATSDSTLNQALEYAQSLPAGLDPTEIVKAIRDQFGRDVKVERVIAAKGENAITDYLGFGAPKPANENGRWKYYAAFMGRVIDTPEEVSDVRGAVVADYQETLEKDWIKDLHNRYKVKVNKDVLKKVK